MGGGVIAEIGERRDAAENFIRVERMFADRIEFLGSELPRLFEDGVGDTEFADVVEEGGTAQAAEVRAGETEVAANLGVRRYRLLAGHVAAAK